MHNHVCFFITGVVSAIKRILDHRWCASYLLSCFRVAGFYSVAKEAVVRFRRGTKTLAVLTTVSCRAQVPIIAFTSLGKRQERALSGFGITLVISALIVIVAGDWNAFTHARSALILDGARLLVIA